MEAKTLDQLRADCREELDDEVGPYLYSDEVLDKHLNEAVAEAAIRARLLLDSRTPAITQITLVPGQAVYTLHPDVVIVRRLWLASDPSRPLNRTNSDQLDRFHPQWRTERGTPRFMVRDTSQRQIVLSPVPEVADTLQMVLWRTPTDEEVMADGADEPVIEPMYHAQLYHWACYRAFMKKDSERNDPKAAADHLALFEQAFGLRPSAAKLQQLQYDQLSSTHEVWF